MNEKTKTPAEKSKTLQGIIIAVVCTILAMVAQAAGVDYDSGATKEVIIQVVESLSASIVALVGLYFAWKGRHNPDIKPIDTSKKE